MSPVDAAPAAASLKGLLPAELEALAVREGARSFAGRQLLTWMYGRTAASFEAMTDLPRALRVRLAAGYRLEEATVAAERRAADGTIKLLVALHDGARVETVIIPEDDRVTLCVSTQVGCARGCGFCATARMRLARNLAAAEIVEQVVLARRRAAVTNVVFMGMGEPLDNYENVRRAVLLLTAPSGFGLGSRHVTVSTVGIVPRIRQLATDRVPACLTLSLTAPDDDLRSRLMPVNRSWPIAEVLGALRDWADTTRRTPTLAYVLLKGVNDDLVRAGRLAALALKARAKVNLIPFNATLGFERPPEEVVTRFQEVLKRRGVIALIRRERGGEIAAACGQLATEAGRA